MATILQGAWHYHSHYTLGEKLGIRAADGGVPEAWRHGGMEAWRGGGTEGQHGIEMPSRPPGPPGPRLR